MDLSKQLKAIERQVYALTGQRDALVKAKVNLCYERTKLEGELEVLNQTQGVLNKLCELSLDRKEGLERLLSYGLSFVVEESLELEFKIGQRAGSPTLAVRLKSYRSGEVLDTAVWDYRGGGLVNIVDFVLRVVLLLVVKPSRRRILVLDEPFKDVSEDLMENLIRFISQLVKKVNIQLLIVTHNYGLQQVGDVVYVAKQSKGITEFRRA